MPTRLKLSDDTRRWWTLAAMCFALFMVMLDNTVVNVALPSIQRDLESSLSALEWVVNAYTLPFAVLLVTGGRLGDLFGRRRVFVQGIVLFAAASATIGFAPTEGWLIAARAVQGVGAALMLPGSLSILTHAFPPAERGKAIGIWSGVSALALAVGPVAGGWLTQEVSWRAIFFLNLPVAAGAVLITLYAAQESRDDGAPRALDLPGITALTVALGALVLALVEGNAWGWESAPVLGLLVTAAAVAAGFVAIERRAAVPVVDLDALASRAFLGANVVGFAITFAAFSTFFFLALYMQRVLGYGPLEAGLRFLPSTLGVVLVGPLSGRLTDRVGPRAPMVAGLLVASVALLWQSRIEVDSGYGALWPSFLLMGVGMGLVVSPMSTAAMNAVDRSKAGVASGTVSMSRMIGGTVGVAALSALMAARGGDPGADPTAFVDALSTGLVVGAAATLVAAAAAWRLVAPPRAVLPVPAYGPA